MSDNPDIGAVRAVYESLAKGDLDHLRDHLLADDVVFHVPGRGVFAGDIEGVGQVIDYLTKLDDRSSWSFEPRAFFAGEGQVAVHLRIRGERGERRLEQEGVQVFRVVDGRIHERWSFPEDTYVIDEFLA